MATVGQKIHQIFHTTLECDTLKAWAGHWVLMTSLQIYCWVPGKRMLQQAPLFQRVHTTLCQLKSCELLHNCTINRIWKR